MAQLMTSWRARSAAAPGTIAESHVVPVGATAYFRKPGITVANLGSREAGLFLRQDGLIVADVPIVRVPSKTEATWIASKVLTKAYVKACGGFKLIRTCCCQYGLCGHCGAGRHEECTTRVGFEGTPRRSPATHLVTRNGSVRAELWMTGTACRWVCPCTDCDVVPEPTAAKAEAYRRAGRTLLSGDTVWLTPKTLGCPRICWSQPRATVVKGSDYAYVIVRVGDVTHRVHEDNIRRIPPGEVNPGASRSRKVKPAPPEGYTEIPLF